MPATDADRPRERRSVALEEIEGGSNRVVRRDHDLVQGVETVHRVDLPFHLLVGDPVVAGVGVEDHVEAFVLDLPRVEQR